MNTSECSTSRISILAAPAGQTLEYRFLALPLWPPFLELETAPISKYSQCLYPSVPAFFLDASHHYSLGKSFFSNRIIRLMKNNPGFMEASLVDPVANFFFFSFFFFAEAGCDQLEASERSRWSQWVLSPMPPPPSLSLLSPLQGFFKAFLLRFDGADSSDVNSS